MMRKLLVTGIVAIVVGFAACGKAPVLCDGDSLLQKAQLCPDRESLGFAMEFGSGTYIGQKPVEALGLRNGGIEDLSLTSVSTAGDPAFKFSGSWAEDAGGGLPATTVKGNKTVFVRVEFAPTQARLYTGTLTVASNAENTPNRIFNVSGCGIPPDPKTPDGGPVLCNPDGGSPGCSGATFACHRTGVCMGLSPCYRDGGLPP